ncbi:sensor histidine kinase [Paenibacillus elgii]
MRGASAAMFLRDRLVYAFVCLLLIGLGVGLMLLERARHPEGIGTGTISYFVILGLFVAGVWLAVDYIRQRAYYKQLMHAVERSGELQTAAIVQSAVTSEQRLVMRLLREQHSAYLNELGQYRRQQEQHNHFVLQWVHHMKTPVSVIDLLVQDALHQLPLAEEEQKQLALSLQEEAERMTRGLDLMLNTARLDKFRMDLHFRQTALHELVRTVMNAHKRLCIRHSIFPQIEGEAWAETDGKWMTVVLNQFVSNAIKYSKGKPGAKKLIFRLAPDADGGSKLSVTDEGIGIAPHDLPRIFDPFFTGENGREAGESTGMGLYLAKQVCSGLGHRLTVESKLGEGTTFTVLFQPRSIHTLGDKDERDTRFR